MQESHLENPFPEPSDLTPPPLPIKSPNEFQLWNDNHKFKFYGNAAEYFGIWIVNILLIIITIGFYSPWAKVRKLRYFYGNTELINRRFDFTGIPSRILIGRLIALGLYLGIGLLSKYSLIAATFGFLIIYLAIPWLICATLRFRGRNSKFGNSRFYFSGTNKRIYLEFFKGILLTIFTLGLAFPVLVWLYRRYFLDHLYVGQLKFKLKADWVTYFGAMYIPILGFICLLGCVGFFAFFFNGLFSILSAEQGLIVFSGLYFLCILFIWPWMSARVFIATWNNTALSESQFKTSCSEWRYAWIVFSNWAAKILTLGLMTPWAEIRLYKYQVESIDIQLNNDPDTMLNRLQGNPIGIAEEIADVFDFDISL